MTVEEKVIEKIRKVLIADATLEPYLNTRVYASHISSILEPKFPAVSIFQLPSRQWDRVPEVYQVRLQIDAWFPSDAYNMTDIYAILDRIRALLHRQDLTDIDIGVVVYNSAQVESGPLLYEEETQLLHLPALFEMVAK